MIVNCRKIISLFCVSSLLFVFIGCENSLSESDIDEDEESIESVTETIKNEKSYSEGLEFVSRGDGTAILTGIGTCTDTNIMIPPTTPAGDSVAEIGDYAFAENYEVISIEVPDTVTTIGPFAFVQCSNLTSVSIPDSVTIITSGVFQCCDNLTEVYLPENFMVYTGNSDNPYESSETAGYSIIANSLHYEVNNERQINGMSELDWLNNHGYIEFLEEAAAIESHNAAIAEVVDQLNDQLN